MKLSRFVRLSSDDVTALDRLATMHVRQIAAREELTREGERPRHLTLVLDGWAYRSKLLEDGRRQIVGIILPGDLCDFNLLLVQHIDHSITALTPLTCAELDRSEVSAALTGLPRLLRALWWDLMVTMEIQREWIVSLGQRSSLERLAHLLCELYLRAELVGLVHDGELSLPLTQHDLAETTGITTVHLNRMVRELRRQRLVDWKGRRLQLLDLDGLRRLALFSTSYLHLDHEGRRFDAPEAAA